MDLFARITEAFRRDARLSGYFDLVRVGRAVRIVTRLVPDAVFDVKSWSEFERWRRWLFTPVGRL